MESTGERLRRMIKESGMTQKELAAATGLTEVAITRYVKLQRYPRSSALSKIADALGVTMDSIMHGSCDDNDPYESLRSAVVRYARRLTDAQRYEMIRLIVRGSGR